MAETVDRGVDIFVANESNRALAALAARNDLAAKRSSKRMT